MFYSKIDDIDTTNCKGVGVSIFVSGCTRRCKGCFNKDTWNFKNGEPFDDDVLRRLKAWVQRSYIDSFSILGGEPFEERNKEEVLNMIKEMRTLKKPVLNIYIWSGNT
jgi:anaerobic ribonucleoside-triphosphate reductase activating protein